MENQNCILGYYEKSSNRTGHETLNAIECGYFLRKNKSEKFFYTFLRKDDKILPPKDPLPDLVKRMKQEKMITLCKKHERKLDVTQKIIIDYKPLREDKEARILEAMKEDSQDSGE